MLLKMTKVEIVGPKKYFYDILSLLHRLGTLHIEDLSKKISPGDMLMHRMEVTDDNLELKQELEELAVKVNGILSVFEPVEALEEEKEKFYGKLQEGSWSDLASKIRKFLEEIEEKVRALAAKKSDLEYELASLSTYESAIEKVQPLAKQLIALEGFETVALLIEKKYKTVLDLIRQELTKITKNQFELVSADVDEDTTSALIIFNKTYSEPVHRFLYDQNVNELRLPPDVADKPFDAAINLLRERKTKIPIELEKVKGHLKKLSQDWYLKLFVAKEALADRLEELKKTSQFGETTFTFIVNGWIPKKYFAKAKKALQEKFGERTLLREVEVSPEKWEEAPVMYENPKLIKPFEFLMRLLPPPRYGTVDPTPFLGLFFPAFFGVMVGDVGYGILIIFLAWYLRKRFKKLLFVQDIGAIFNLCGITTILFGFFYGEFFGNLPERFHLVREVHFLGLTLPFERAKAEVLILLLIFAAAIGIGHVFLGLFLGVVNALREKSRKHLFEKVGMFVVLFSLLLLLAVMAQALPKALTNPGAALLIIGVVLLIYGAGFMGILEVISSIGNLISYLRLAAVGLASVMLALVANELGGIAGNILIGIVIAGLLHLLNLVLAIISPSIQSLRLHFVEFFSKFYESGGREYKPFKRTGGV